MDKIDIYYDSFAEYRKGTRENNDCARQRKYISRANADEDKIEVVVNECDIEDDWVNEIEKGLDFIEKAIKEERQFIFSNGEVVPVEKVKNVSKESVEHLAKHSNLLTRMPKEGEDLIPDKLYTVERLTDFAVYENRFLYMLLCYLRDFISLRYNNILGLVTTYNGKMVLNKTVSVTDRKAVVQIVLDEHLKNDKYLKEHNSAKEKLERIDGLLKAVVSFLSYPLMEEVSKAPMLKPPIVETNVLKMNKNFKGAMQLYYYITAYTKQGYTCRTEKRTLSPFKEHVSDEISELVELSSFLTYEYGMGIEGDLKARYDARLKKQREAEQKKKEEQLELLRKRIRENGGNAEEYMLLLEQRNRSLEADSVQLGRAKLEIKGLNEKIGVLNEEIQTWKGEVASYQQQLTEKEEELARLIEEHANELASLTQAHEAEVAALKEEHANELASLTQAHEAEVAALKEEHATQLAQKQEEHENAIARLHLEHKNAVAELKKEHANEIARKNEEIRDEQARFEQANKAEAIAMARLNSLKKQYGSFDGSENFTSQEGFDELEREYKYFKALFKEQWKLTKKGIRAKNINWNIFGKKSKMEEQGMAQTEAPLVREEQTEEQPRVEEQLTQEAAQASTDAAEQNNQ